jgi:hypothetical protein
MSWAEDLAHSQERASSDWSWWKDQSCRVKLEQCMGHIYSTELKLMWWGHKLDPTDLEAGKPLEQKQGEFGQRRKMRGRTKAVRVELERRHQRRARVWRWGHQKDTCRQKRIHTC